MPGNQAARKVVVVQLEGRGRPRIDLERDHRIAVEQKIEPGQPAQAADTNQTIEGRLRLRLQGARKADARDRTGIAIVGVAERLDPEPVEPEAVGAITVAEKSRRQRLTGGRALEVHPAAGRRLHGGTDVDAAGAAGLLLQPATPVGRRFALRDRHAPSGGAQERAAELGVLQRGDDRRFVRVHAAVAREPGSELRCALEPAAHDNCNVGSARLPGDRGEEPAGIDRHALIGSDAHDFRDGPRVTVAERIEHDDALMRLRRGLRERTAGDRDDDERGCHRWQAA